MAYFPHAYKKVFLAKDVELTAGTGSDALASGEIALLGSDFQSVAATGLTAGLYTLAQGSLHTVDKIGPQHGGYQESVKSKGINTKYISKIWTVDAATASAGTATLPTKAGQFDAGKTVFVRVDVKGSPALRFLGRNAYFVADYTTDCDDANSPVDASKVLLAIADQIEADPIVGKFVEATVEQLDAAGTAWNAITAATTDNRKCRLILTGAYVDTQFGDCSFRPTDFFEKEPVQVFLSELNETGDICDVDFDAATRVEAVQGNGFGESVIREFILSNRYAQEPWNNDPRMRETADAIAFQIDRTASYKTFNILHSIPRSYNPSGMHNSDQYLLSIVAVDGSTAAGDVDTLVGALATAAGLTVESY